MTDNPKAIYPFNFFKVGGIIQKMKCKYVPLLSRSVGKAEIKDEKTFTLRNIK